MHPNHDETSYQLEQLPEGVDSAPEPGARLWYQEKPYIHDPDKRKKYVQQVYKSRLGRHIGQAKTLTQA